MTATAGTANDAPLTLPPGLLEVAQELRFTHWQRWQRVILPTASPSLLAGIHLGPLDGPLGNTEKARTVREHIALVGLGGFESAYAHPLCGGMSQRVAIASALVGRPGRSCRRVGPLARRGRRLGQRRHDHQSTVSTDPTTRPSPQPPSRSP